MPANRSWRRWQQSVGSAGPAGPKDAAKELVTCDAPIATIALAESPNGYTVLSQYQLPPTPLPLIRVMMQQSDCFRVVDRAAGLRGTIQSRNSRMRASSRRNRYRRKAKVSAHA